MFCRKIGVLVLPCLPHYFACTFLSSAYIIVGVSRGKGQDLFLRAFHESLQIVKEKKFQVPSMHAVVVGSDMNAQTKFETELRKFVVEKNIQDRVHFVNKTLTVAPYLAAIDVLVQNSQVLILFGHNSLVKQLLNKFGSFQFCNYPLYLISLYFWTR